MECQFFYNEELLETMSCSAAEVVNMPDISSLQNFLQISILTLIFFASATLILIFFKRA